MADHVTAQTVRANGLWNPFTGRKKFTFSCGKCDYGWSDKIPFVDRAKGMSICPACGTVNEFSFDWFQKQYDAETA